MSVYIGGRPFPDGGEGLFLCEQRGGTFKILCFGAPVLTGLSKNAARHYAMTLQNMTVTEDASVRFSS